MTSGAYDLAAAGDVMVDVVAARTSERHAPVEIRAGGSAVNAARATVAAGRTALVVGCVGDDPLGRLVRDELDAAGIDAHLSIVRGARTGRGVFAAGAVVAERGANAAFAPEHVPDVEAAAVLVSGYQLLRPDSEAGARAALRLGGVAGVDLGSEQLVRSLDRERLAELLDGVDVVVGAEGAVAAVEAPVVVATYGPEGARSGGVHVRPPHVVDDELLGAGDAFAAVLLLALADRVTLEEALERACAAAVS